MLQQQFGHHHFSRLPPSGPTSGRRMSRFMASTGPCTIAPVGSGSYGRSRHGPIRQLRPQRRHTPGRTAGTGRHIGPPSTWTAPQSRSPGTQHTNPGCANRRGGYNKPGMISLLFIELRNGILGVIYVRTGPYRIVIVLVWYNSLLRILLCSLLLKMPAHHT